MRNKYTHRNPYGKRYAEILWGFGDFFLILAIGAKPLWVYPYRMWPLRKSKVDMQAGTKVRSPSDVSLFRRLYGGLYALGISLGILHTAAKDIRIAH